MANTCDSMKTVTTQLFERSSRKVPNDVSTALRSACSAKTPDCARRTLTDQRRFSGEDAPPASYDLIGDVDIFVQLHAERAPD